GSRDRSRRYWGGCTAPLPSSCDRAPPRLRRVRKQLVERLPASHDARQEALRADPVGEHIHREPAYEEGMEGEAEPTPPVGGIDRFAARGLEGRPVRFHQADDVRAPGGGPEHEAQELHEVALR